MSLTFVAKSSLPTQWGEFDIHAFEDSDDGQCHLAISMGLLALVENTEGNNNTPILMRIHSECLTGDALFSQRCDCGSQLQNALQIIAERGKGLILYLRQEGRGIGLANKIKAYQLQDAGADTVEANEQLGFPADMRSYDICGPMLQHFSIDCVELMTNNPEKIAALVELGITVDARRPHQYGSNSHNSHYLKTKADKLGHQF